jgi:excisionase family DNA binding protein
MRLYSITTAAKVCGVTRQTIYDWLKSGRLSYHFHVDKRAVFTIEELDKAILSG